MYFIKKSLRLIYTLRYVKPVQLYFQIWYRLKKAFLKIEWYRPAENLPFTFVRSTVFEDVILSKNKYKGKNSFEFLNIPHCFNKKIDWNFAGNGKLWNYNLQYFDFLLDPSLDLEQRILLLDDFSTQLLNGKIELEPYPVSLRITNSIIFLSANGIDHKNIEKAVKLQINYLRKNLEYHLLANHLLENIFALYIASFCINDVKLFKKAEYLLHKELEKQVLSDGAHYECSAMYHSIILSKLLLSIDIAEQNNVFTANSKLLKARAGRMVEWINAYSFPDGGWALFNDAALNIAPDTITLNRVATSMGIGTGPGKITESGYRKLSNKNLELIAKTGNIIPAYQPGHTHADMLSFCFWNDGMQCIVDTAVSTYNNNQQRQKERGTGSHNTIVIGNQNQSDVWSAFRIGKRANCQLIIDKEDQIAASHNGYRSSGVIHQREFVMTEAGVLIKDLLNGLDSEKKGESLLHFDHEITPMLDGRVIRFHNVSIEFDSGYSEIQLITYQQSTQFNQLKTAYKLIAKVEKASSFSIKRKA